MGGHFLEEGAEKSARRGVGGVGLRRGALGAAWVRAAGDKVASGCVTDGSREMAPAQQALATMQRSSSEQIVSGRSKKSDITDTYCTPTNIEDPLVDFGSTEVGAAHESKGRRDSSKPAAASLTADLDLSNYYKQRRRSSMRRSSSDPSLVWTQKL